MGAEYTSNEKDGYCAMRNEVYREREMKQQEHTVKMARDAKVPAPQSDANYGYGKIKY